MTSQINGLGNQASIGVHSLDVKISDSSNEIIVSDTFNISASLGGYESSIELANSSGSTLYNYQVQVTLDTQALIATGKMRADGGDLRFTDSDGLTNLSYWVDPSTLNTNATKIWVKVPDITNGKENIFLNYGNSYLTSQSSGKDVFSFFDDFSGTTLDTTKWNEIDTAANYITQEGTLKFNGGSSNWTNAVFSNATFTRPMVFEVDYMRTGNNYAMLGLHDPGAGSSYTDLVYAAYPVYDGNGSRLLVYEDGSHRGDNLKSITSNEWQTYKFEVFGTGAKYYQEVNNGSYTQFYNSSYSSESPLKIGFANYNQIFEVDNCKVSPGYGE
jgi:hypothetical protein